MSALARPPRAVDGWRSPSLFRLLSAVLGGEVLGAVTLWIVGIVLEIAAVAPLGGAQQWVWLPWQIDGIWALVGALGWGYLVCSLIGRLVRERVERRGYGPPAAGWVRISIGISGYGAMAVGHTPGAHIVVAVVAGAVLIRFVAFSFDGSARAWRWSLTPRVQVAAALVALLVALSYSATHGFAADGSGANYSSAVIVTRVGHAEQVEVGLSRVRAPVEITGVSLTGAGAAHFSVSSIVLSTNGLDETVIPRTLRTQPGAHQFSGYVWHPTRLPYRVPAGQEVWITALVRLSSCGDVRVNTLKLQYTILGIGTGESIPLQQPLTMACRR